MLIGYLILNEEKIIRTCGEIGIRDRFGQCYYSGVFWAECQELKSALQIEFL